MKILVATDAAPPQVNGVVRTYLRLAQELERRGVTLSFIKPDDFVTLPQPFYREIRMSLPAPSRMVRLIEAAAPDYVHIATEGPVGWVARHVLKSSGRPFTTSYHTKFPEYASALFCLPERIGYRLARFSVVPITDFEARLGKWAVKAGMRPTIDRLYGGYALSARLTHR